MDKYVIKCENKEKWNQKKQKYFLTIWSVIKDENEKTI